MMSQQNTRQIVDQVESSSSTSQQGSTTDYSTKIMIPIATPQGPNKMIA